MSELIQAYRAYRSQLYVRLNQIGYILLLGFVALSVLLDYFVYREQWTSFLPARMVCELILLGALGLVHTRFGKENSHFFGVFWVLPMVGYVAWIIFKAEGFVSPYYIGIALVVLGGCLWMPWNFKECIIANVITVLAYALAGVGHAVQHGMPTEMGDIGHTVLNCYFVLLFVFISLISSFVIERRRFHEFELQYQLDRNKRQLEASYEKLAELDEAKTRFFANISHELRTPLMLVLSPLESLQAAVREHGDHASDETLSIMQTNALRLLGLINDLLDLVRLEEGRLEPDKKPMELQGLLRGLIGSIRHMADRNGLTLEISENDPDVFVLADQGQLEKVFLNLLFNAIKFTPEGGSVSVSVKDESGRAVVLIQDTGIGISEDKLVSVFDRFWQEDGSDAQKRQGTGIGLSLVKELIDLHDGRVEVKSTKGEGTTFRITLPVTEERPLEMEPKVEKDSARDTRQTWVNETYQKAMFAQFGPSEEKPAASGPGARVDHRLYRLLIVEDEPDMRRFLVNELKGSYNIMQAADGLEGLDLAIREQPDLILTDMMMPGIDGITLCRRLRANPEMLPTKIILLTARADDRTKLDALEAGADDFLPKPCGTAELKTRLANLVSNARLERELQNQNRFLEETLQRLRETESQLIQSERLSALGSLSAGIMHEINNPVNFMLTATNYLKNSLEKPSEEVAETVSDIEEGLVRIRDIIADLKGFAYGKPSGDKMECGTEKLWRTVKRLLAQDLGDVELEEEIDDDAQVWGDHNQLIQLVTNIVQNAIQATQGNPDREKKRLLKVRMGVEGKNYVIAVRDNGMGIEEKIRSQLFDPFFTTKDVGEGMGLGLSICHTLVKHHDGEIFVDSEPGEFAEFTVRIPHQDVPDVVEQPVEENSIFP